MQLHFPNVINIIILTKIIKIGQAGNNVDLNFKQGPLYLNNKHGLFIIETTEYNTMQEINLFCRNISKCRPSLGNGTNMQGICMLDLISQLFPGPPESLSQIDFPVAVVISHYLYNISISV